MPSCTLSVSDLGFGNYDVFGANATTAMTATAPIVVQCNYGATPQLQIYGNAGNSVAIPGGTAAWSDMLNNNNSAFALQYIYGLDNPLNVNTNSNTPATWTAGKPVTYTLTGTIPAGTNTATGNYNGQLQANLTF